MGKRESGKVGRERSAAAKMRQREASRGTKGRLLGEHGGKPRRVSVHFLLAAARTEHVFFVAQFELR